eukprot:c4940_g1_i1.p1 GENE.c4940_g1_i1~~c4940_g1_i1.p1  ORF type:complete len:241 (+),score=38.25 c4940_g1_i1:109-723(+)
MSTFPALCVLDFEANCEENKTISPQEIIEFPTLLLDRSGTVVSEFHEYIRPVAHPKLTPFCTQLTGIEQHTVDQGILLQEALHRHHNWLLQHNLITEVGTKRIPFIYVTCGDWDLNRCLPSQLRYEKLPVPSYLTEWINIKKEYSRYFGVKCHGMTDLLEKCGLPLEGRHHSGIDDCRNIARIVSFMISKGWVPTEESVNRRAK